MHIRSMAHVMRYVSQRGRGRLFVSTTPRLQCLTLPSIPPYVAPATAAVRPEPSELDGRYQPPLNIVHRGEKSDGNRSI